MPRKHIQRITKRPSPVVEQWIVFLKRALALRKQKQYVGEDLLARTAGLISLFGPVGDHKGTEVYQAIVPLIFSYHRIRMWGKFLDAVPATVLDISKLVAATKAAATLEPIERAQFPLLHFVTISLVLPDARAYVEVCRRENIRMIRKAFHPNTVEWVKGRYRGVVGATASAGYREQLSATLRTISE